MPFYSIGIPKQPSLSISAMEWNGFFATLPIAVQKKLFAISDMASLQVCINYIQTESNVLQIFKTALTIAKSQLDFILK